MGFSELTPAVKIALGAAAAGLVGGVVAERLASPVTIERAAAADRWNAAYDSFVNRYPVPRGTRVFVAAPPPWQNAAIAGGAAAGVAALGGGAMFAASRMRTPSIPIATAGLAAVTLGVAALAGVGASWAIRGE